MLGPCLMITSYPRRIPLILSSGGGFQVISSRDPFSWTVTFRGNTDGTEKDQRRRTKRVRSRNNYRAAKRRLPLKSFFLQFGARPLPSMVETIQLNNPLWWGKEGNLEEPHPWNVFSEFPMWPFRGEKNAEIKWIWHFCDEDLLWATHVASVHSYFCTLLPEVGNV